MHDLSISRTDRSAYGFSPRSALPNLAPILSWAVPLGGAFLGWTRGDDLLRRNPYGQSAVGWLSNSPVGSLLGHDPYKPVGGALGALAGVALGSLFR